MLHKEDQSRKIKKGKDDYAKRKVGECFQWECTWATAFGNTGEGQRRNGRTSSPASNSKAKTDAAGEKPSKELGNKEESSVDHAARHEFGQVNTCTRDIFGCKLREMKVGWMWQGFEQIEIQLISRCRSTASRSCPPCLHETRGAEEVFNGSLSRSTRSAAVHLGTRFFSVPARGAPESGRGMQNGSGCFGRYDCRVGQCG